MSSLIFFRNGILFPIDISVYSLSDITDLRKMSIKHELILDRSRDAIVNRCDQGKSMVNFNPLLNRLGIGTAPYNAYPK